MSYTYIEGATVGPTGCTDEMFQAIREALLTQGWTVLHVFSDVAGSTAGSRDIVFKGKELHVGIGNAPIIRLSTYSATQLKSACYTDWDTATNVGANETGGSSNQTAPNFSDSPFAYLIRVNDVSFAVAAKLGAQYDRSYQGFLRRGLPSAQSGVVSTSAPSVAGATVLNVSQDPRSSLRVGQMVQIHNHSGDSTSPNYERVELRMVSALTVDSVSFSSGLTGAFDAGALVGVNPLPVICSGSTGTLNTVCGTVYQPTRPNGARTGPTGQSVSTAYETPASYDYTSEAYYRSVSGVFHAYNSATSHRGGLGTFYHYAPFQCDGTVAIDDIFTDGVSEFRALHNQSSSHTMAIGPRAIEIVE